MKTRLTELLNIRYPIIQGGLAYIADANLAQAVSNAGGLGQITALTLADKGKLRNEIKKVREMTSKPFGVNFAIGQHGRAYEDYFQVALEEKVPVITMTGGNPAPMFEQLKDLPIKKLVLVANLRQAQKAEELGADAVMVVGQEGGGHLGRDDVSTLVLVRKVIEKVRIPVVASGGIGDGYGLLAALALGAEGIEMGTRFVATKESSAHPLYKELIVKSTETDTDVIKRTLGTPARAIKNSFTAKILELEQRGATYDDLQELISGKSNVKAAIEGDVENGYMWAGQVIGLIKDVPTVDELMKRIITEAEQGLNKLKNIF